MVEEGLVEVARLKRAPLGQKAMERGSRMTEADHCIVLGFTSNLNKHQTRCAYAMACLHACAQARLPTRGRSPLHSLCDPELALASALSLAAVSHAVLADVLVVLHACQH